jgi:FkbM family methyltransferase
MFQIVKNRARKKVVSLVERTVKEGLFAPEVRLAAHEGRIAALEDRCGQQGKPVDYCNVVGYEAAVNLALRDLCRPGDICFDVGAHAGFLTMLMSRLVGPTGHVCAFEPNENNVKLCRQNLNYNGCYNCTLIDRAVYNRSNERLRFYVPASAMESQVGSLYGEGNEFQTVNTLALDDFITACNLRPRLIKMDIEGAEHDALVGCQRYLESGKPHLVLEQTINDGEACLLLLEELGYVVLDLSNYRVVRRPTDYAAHCVVRNVLAIHRDRLAETPYQVPMEFRHLFDATAEEFESRADGHSAWRNYRFQASPGRYALVVEFEAEGENSYIELKAFVNQKNCVYYGGTAKWICLSYRDFVVDVDKAGEVHVQFMLPNHTPDPTFRLKGLTCSQVVDFPQRAHFAFA